MVCCEDQRFQIAEVAAGDRIASLRGRKSVHLEKFLVWLQNFDREHLFDCDRLHDHRREDDSDS